MSTVCKGKDLRVDLSGREQNSKREKGANDDNEEIILQRNRRTCKMAISNRDL